MTLLDGDGPFNYSTLMQSAVNTLNQAAEEEAAYPSSLPFSPPLFPSLAHTLHLFHPSLGLILICFISFSLRSLFLLSTFPPLCQLYQKVLYADTPQCLSYTDSKLC